MRAKLLETAKPILFNTEMVKAIQDGRKVQTRRVANSEMTIQPDEKYKYSIRDKRMLWNEFETLEEFITFSSKYKKGDVLYVRETFCIGKYESMYIGEGCGEPTIISQCNGDNDVIYYSDAIEYCDFSELDKHDLPKWKPSIHMPKKYARIFLPIMDVNVEKIQDITFEDIFKEGFNGLIKDYFISVRYKDKAITATTIEELEILNWWITIWNSTSKDGYKWEDNPYVFIYESEVIK